MALLVVLASMRTATPRRRSALRPARASNSQAPRRHQRPSRAERERRSGAVGRGALREASSYRGMCSRSHQGIGRQRGTTQRRGHWRGNTPVGVLQSAQQLRGRSVLPGERALQHGHQRRPDVGKRCGAVAVQPEHQLCGRGCGAPLPARRYGRRQLREDGEHRAQEQVHRRRSRGRPRKGRVVRRLALRRPEAEADPERGEAPGLLRQADDQRLQKRGAQHTSNGP
mmetsp:Transcript_120763/g.376028  ORF Transcript_120763/g.376028 Transcript_120763/m.376028 type:complete len:227 (-) Transcript_120763:752-1432(-)